MFSAGIIETSLPIAIIGVAAIILPRLVVPQDTRSHRTVFARYAIVIVLLLILGPALYALFDTRGLYEAGSLAEALQILRIIFRQSLTAAIIWVPILVLNWFGSAQRVEAMRGQDMLREDQS